MRLSRVRVTSFAAEWRNAAYEKGETQSFYNDFLEVFGVRLPGHVEAFGFILGVQCRRFRDQDPVNIEACTISVSRRWAGPCWAVPRKREAFLIGTGRRNPWRRQ